MFLFLPFLLSQCSMYILIIVTIKQNTIVVMCYHYLLLLTGYYKGMFGFYRILQSFSFVTMGKKLGQIPILHYPYQTQNLK